MLNTVAASCAWTSIALPFASLLSSTVPMSEKPQIHFADCAPVMSSPAKKSSLESTVVCLRRRILN